MLGTNAHRSNHWYIYLYSGTLVYHPIRKRIFSLETFALIDLITVALLVLRCFSYNIYYQMLMRLLIGGVIGLNFIGIFTYLISCLPINKRAFSGFILCMIIVGTIIAYFASFMTYGVNVSPIRWLLIFILPIIPCLGRIYAMKSYYPFNSVE